ncbi:MAG: DUF2179 domain-containing protein [Planctomycetota bacterium]|jgi:uncharacterized protein YebE (UPF0316 family)
MWDQLDQLHWFALPAAIFFARICDVSVGTVRIICVTRGFRSAAVLLAFIEILIWVAALSAVLFKLNRVENLLAFAGGFAAGNAIGMWLEQKLALGTQMVGLVSRNKADEIAQHLRGAGYLITRFCGDGRDGPVGLCLSIVPRRRVTSMISTAREIDPALLATVSDVRESLRPLAAGQLCGKLPAGMWFSRMRPALLNGAGHRFPTRKG